MIRILIFLFLPSLIGFAQPFPNAHSHNDYEHEHPLFDAIRNGFTSVEADIFLVNGKLRVGHTRLFLQSGTLEELYFAPLDSIVRVNHHSVYTDDASTFYLMIDIKSNGDEAYPILVESLRTYPALQRTKGLTPAVIIFLSGERPVEKVLNDTLAWFALDGRPRDLGKGIDPARIPVVSDNFNKWSAWNGKGVLPTGDFQKIKKLAGQVHAEGKRLRLWAIPDHPTAWAALLDAGVDIINTDHLEELSLFLKSRNK